MKKSPNHGVIVALSLFLCSACSSLGYGPTKHFVDQDALGPYSSAVSSAGWCFVSGKIGERGGSFEHEARTAILSVVGELGAIGLSLADVVSANVYLTDIELYGEFNEVYAELFPAPYPARACVAVAALPGGARVEVQVVARR